MQMDYKGLLEAVKASILASSCCTLPIVIAFVLSLFGAGSVAAAYAIPRYKILFIALGTVFLTLSLYAKIRRKCGGACTIRDVGREKNLILASYIAFPPDFRV